MKISALVHLQYKTIVSILKQKEKLEARLRVVDKKLVQFEKHNISLDKTVNHILKGNSRGTRRVNLKGNILTLLKAAGAQGLKVSAIATKLNLPSNNIYSWFYTTGKKVRGVKKVSPGRYALKK